MLAIPPKIIDPRQRNAIAILSRFSVIAYNKNLIPPRQVPKTWEDILRPEFKGRKFAVDIRPQELAALVPGWGLEKTLDFSRKLAAQQPIWVRGGTRTLVAMGAGEVPLFFGVNYDSVKRYQRKDPSGTAAVCYFGACSRQGHFRACNSGEVQKSSRSPALVAVHS